MPSYIRGNDNFDSLVNKGLDVNQNGGVGDFALCKSQGSVSYGATVAGSSLTTTGFYTAADNDGSWTITNGSSLPGTWKCKGTIGSGRGVTLFQRIA